MSQVVIIGSKEDVKRLIAEQELAELDALRAGLRVSSIEYADGRMELIEAELRTAEKILQDAYLNYDEQADLDFETARDRAERLENIEREYDRLSKLWRTARKRQEYLAKDAAKAA